MALIYVTGGAKSGKSRFAENLLLEMNNGNQKNIYLATSIVFDEEMKSKVALHKERRQDKWLTVEGYKNFKIYICHLCLDISRYTASCAAFHRILRAS